MAKRQDELAAYNFARKRTVAAFLAPSPGGSEEGAPRPMRTVTPSLALGVVLVIGFIAYGVIKPTAPAGWDKAGEYIIVDSDSTTRYVVIDDKTSTGKKVATLHPVLNYASAKLLLDKGKGSVLEVPGSEIDKSSIPHGATIGIPYAPDRLPSASDAEKPKTWAVCERPGAGGSDSSIDRAVFVLDADDAKTLDNPGKVGSGEALYVKDSKTQREYLVDGKGTAFLLGGQTGLDSTGMESLRSAVIGSSNRAEPQLVSTEWLKTLNFGGGITFPSVPNANQPTSVQGLPTQASTVGQVLKAEDAQGWAYYVVLKDKVAAVSPFVAALLEASPSATGGNGAVKVDRQVVIAANHGAADSFYADKGWPEQVPRQANPATTATGQPRTTSCSVYNGTFGADKKPQLAAWAGTTYPKKVVSDSVSAYVSSGSGLLFKELTGVAGGGGAQYLLTDTGLRYSLPSNNDSQAKGSGSGSTSASSSSDGSSQSASETDKARTRLGYGDITNIALVPQTWATFIPKGPTLDTGSASQEQSQ
ncbi:type VII secretion protein EccB [Streptomyces coacervatus]|uniref:Type VII secretion protein EccB n=1 Tax=Streptomyces coacervatus TaxID=647381 RepID=A0ABP7IJN7_9ACTN|nr:type VII secretion protein EccB [Streptomyces coacervatus]MDF2269966.1 type VII secretion protein EccB [Streptomyces coacervatus]